MLKAVVELTIVGVAAGGTELLTLMVQTYRFPMRRVDTARHLEQKRQFESGGKRAAEHLCVLCLELFSVVQLDPINVLHAD